MASSGDNLYARCVLLLVLVVSVWLQLVLVVLPVCDAGVAGGIGVADSNVRAKGSYIRGTNGHSDGLVPLLHNFNETARHEDQGGGE